MSTCHFCAHIASETKTPTCPPHAIVLAQIIKFISSSICCKMCFCSVLSWLGDNRQLVVRKVFISKPRSSRVLLCRVYKYASVLALPSFAFFWKWRFNLEFLYLDPDQLTFSSPESSKHDLTNSARTTSIQPLIVMICMLLYAKHFRNELQLSFSMKLQSIT